MRQRLHEIASQLQSASPVRFWMMRSQPGTPSNRGPGPPLPGMPGGGFPGTPGARALGLQSATLGLSWSDRIYGRYWRYHEFPLEKNTPNELQKPYHFLGNPRCKPQPCNFRSGTSRNASPRNRSGPPSARGPGPPLLMVKTSDLRPRSTLIWGATLGSGPSRERANATLYPRVRNPVAIWTGQNDSTPLHWPSPCSLVHL